MKFDSQDKKKNYKKCQMKPTMRNVAIVLCIYSEPIIHLVARQFLVRKLEGAFICVLVLFLCWMICVAVDVGWRHLIDTYTTECVLGENLLCHTHRFYLPSFFDSTGSFSSGCGVGVRSRRCESAAAAAAAVDSSVCVIRFQMLSNESLPK